MNKTDLAYIAGFFDGEGCINIGLRRYKMSPDYFLTVTFAQTKEKGKEICEWFQNNFKGKVIEKKRREDYHLQLWFWQCNTQQAKDFLKQIYPYLYIKKEQAELAIEFAEKKNSVYCKNCSSEAERKERFSYYETVKQEMHFLNRKGIK